MDPSQLITNVFSAIVALLVLFDRWEKLRTRQSSRAKTDAETVDVFTDAAEQNVKTSLELSEKQEAFYEKQLKIVRDDLARVRRERDAYRKLLELAGLTIPMVE